MNSLSRDLFSWMVYLRDQGASGITLNSGGSKKFLVLSLDSFVQDAFHSNIHETDLLALATLDVILNNLQKMIGQDLKFRGILCDTVYNEMHENLLGFFICR